MTGDELGTPVAITVATVVTLALLVGGAWGDGYLSTRAAYGALTGLGVALGVLTAAYLAHPAGPIGGPDDA